MNRLLFVLFSLNFTFSLAQEIVIKDFSKRFYAKINLDEDQTNQVFKSGKISILTINGNKEIYSIESNSITIEVEHNGKQKMEIPYNNQDVILFQDFNFDNEMDLAISESYSSKGPSYSISLYKNDAFVFDSEFTEIIKNSQGNFELDASSKNIYTTSSGGCCYHSYSTYDVKNGRAFLISEVVTEIDFAFKIKKNRKWENGKFIETVKRTVDLNQDGITEIMSFQLLDKNKRVVLYNLNDRTLNYVLINGEDTSEFFYPIQTVYKNPDFIVSISGNELTFRNKDVQYKIYQKFKTGQLTDIGVLVSVESKEYDLKGDIKSLKGNINKKAISKLDNVYIK